MNFLQYFFQSQFIVAFTILFSFGMVLEFLHFGAIGIIFCTSLCLIVTMVIYNLYSSDLNKNRRIVFLKYSLFTTLFVLLGSARLLIFNAFEVDNMSKSVSLLGNGIYVCKVNNFPIEKNEVNATLDCEVNKGSYNVSATMKKTVEFFYGDTLLVSGELKKTASNEAIFKKVFFDLTVKHYIVFSRGSDGFLSNLFKFRLWIRNFLFEIFPSPKSELMAGLLTEGSDLISKNLKNNFRRTGLSHVVALSGFNVSVVIGAFSFLFASAGRHLKFFSIVFFLLTFSVMTGFSSTIARATIMGIISIIASLKRRRYEPFRALYLSLLVMIIVFPLSLIFDISMQLSFLATLSMLTVTPLVEIFLLKYFKKSFFVNIFSTTVSAQFFTTPIILFYTGNFSVISLVTNFLVVPVLPITMLFGTFPFLFFYSNVLAKIFSLPAYVFLSFILFVVNYGSSLNYASVQFKISFSTLILIYVSEIILMYILYRHVYKKSGFKPDFL